MADASSECASKFLILNHAEQNDRSPAVFSLKRVPFTLGESNGSSLIHTDMCLLSGKLHSQALGLPLDKGWCYEKYKRQCFKTGAGVAKEFFLSDLTDRTPTVPSQPFNIRR